MTFLMVMRSNAHDWNALSLKEILNKNILENCRTYFSAEWESIYLIATLNKMIYSKTKVLKVMQYCRKSIFHNFGEDRWCILIFWYFFFNFPIWDIITKLKNQFYHWLKKLVLCIICFQYIRNSLMLSCQEFD